jgi:hypothetical protein
MSGRVEVEQNLESRFVLATGQGSTVNAIVSQSAEFLKNQGSNPPAIDAPQQRAGFFIDLGGGRHAHRINFIGWEGSTNSWGDTSESAGTVANATGQGPTAQMQCLFQYLRIGQYDSRAENARLRFGEYTDGSLGGTDGLYDDYLHVVFEGAVSTRSAENPRHFDGSLVLTEAESVSDPIDTLLMPKY